MSSAGCFGIPGRLSEAMHGAADEATGAPEAESSEAGFVLLSVLLAVALFMAAAASFAVKSQLAAMQTAMPLNALSASLP